jgi:hypothetical protein
MVGFIQRLPKVEITGASLPPATLFSVFSDFPNLMCAYNMLNIGDSSGLNRPLSLGKTSSDAAFDGVNRYLNFVTSSGSAATGIKTADTTGNSFCAILTVRASNLVAGTNYTSGRKSVFGDYSEDASATVNGFRVGLATDKVTFMCKGADGSVPTGTPANSAFDVTLAVNALNKWRTILVDVQRGTKIKLKVSTGETAETTNANIINYVLGSIRDFQFGNQDEVASISVQGIIGNILHGAILNGTQSDTVHAQLFQAAEKDLTTFNRNFSYA